jgi:hypothetical protein
MKVFSPRETSAQNIAYISIMASIDVVFALFATFFPFGAIFLMLLLPLPSAVAAYYCKNRYIPVYLLASIGLSLIATIWDFQLTLFYAIPAICSGTLYGFLKQKRLTIGEIVSGGERGADALAKRYAEEYGHAYKEFPADRETHGNRAGFLRNEQIIQYSDCCIAFWDGKSRGTKLTIDLCKRYNKPCYICYYGNITAQESLFE